MAFLTSTNVIYWKENLVVFLNFLFILFILGWFWDLITMLPITSRSLKVVFRTSLLVCFLSVKETICETRKNDFLFHFKSKGGHISF